MSRNQTLFPTKRRTKRKSAGFDLTPVVAIIGIIGLTLTIYIAYRTSLSDRKLFSISLLALFGGLLFESFRISDSWKTVIAIFIGSYFFSLLSFLPGKREQHYNFENHIQNWPYFLLFFFALAFAIFHKDRVTAKLTEGITLLLSLSFIYWTIDYGFTNYHNWFAISLLSITFLFTAFSILNALTNLHLSKGVRLTLSIWSTIILLAFAIDNIIRVFSNPDIESKYISDGLYIGLQYFLLGVSAVYIMQNYILLSAFLPSKHGNYRNDLRENKKDHIDRYSDQQVSIGHSFFCIGYTGTIYWLNYTYQILPRHTMIWLVIVTFPLILYISDMVSGRKNYS
jgi:hypothetical protein